MNHILHPRSLRYLALLAVIAMAGCSGGDGANATRTESSAGRPSILLVTLDTTRADAMGPDAGGVSTPSFNALAARGTRFTRAYATAPETLPSHSSLMTGLYPAGHGIHENARVLSEKHPVLAEELGRQGYRTAAFVSSFVLSRRFGLARGFASYDDAMPQGSAERNAVATTERALAFLKSSSGGPLFLWVHYFDPHAPYEPPPEFGGKSATPYLGEVAAMDAQLGRLVSAFESLSPSPHAIAVTGDHGEGLGDHGEPQHGHLLYEPTMRVPFAIAGPGIEPGVSDRPVSIRRVYHTVRDWAGVSADGSLRAGSREVVLGEAMKPFLSYGWQPQVMAIDGSLKAILAGPIESYDVAADPGERTNRGNANLPGSLRKALDEYPVPSMDAGRAGETLSDEAKRQLASLGYVSASVPPVVRKDAPRPADMTSLFDLMEKASGLFVQERYAEVVPLLDKVLAADPNNLDATLRLATAHSSLGHDAQAIEAFTRASELAPGSADVRTYLALHYARGREWPRAVPLLERILEEDPQRWPAVEGLAVVRERQGRIPDAIALRQKLYAARTASPRELVHLGGLAMATGQTPLAIESFEKARSVEGTVFDHDLELGVLYLAAGRLQEARDALDRVPASHRDYPMALFKRAQVSVLLGEPDRAERIARAKARADGTTRELIAKEKLFAGGR
jgi:tetratricopeptide (TPR) repeat protein